MRSFRGRINRGVARPGRWAADKHRQCVIASFDIIYEASAGARRCWSGLEDEASAEQSPACAQDHTGSRVRCLLCAFGIVSAGRMNNSGSEPMDVLRAKGRRSAQRAKRSLFRAAHRYGLINCPVIRMRRDQESPSSKVSTLARECWLNPA